MILTVKQASKVLGFKMIEVSRLRRAGSRPDRHSSVSRKCVIVDVGR